MSALATGRCGIMARSTVRTINIAIRLGRLSSGMLSGYLVAVSLWLIFFGWETDLSPSEVRQLGLVEPQQHVPLQPHDVQPSLRSTVTGSATKKRRLQQNRYPRILCWVVTSPMSVIKANLVKRTWGKRCDKLLFMSSTNDSSLPTVGFALNGPESRQQLWNKANLTFQYVYKHFIDQYDWFFKADDDTYAIVDNMRIYLRSLDSSLPYFLGRRFIGFLSGGCGYLMTARTIRLLVEQGLGHERCRQVADKLSGDQDDLILSVCLDHLGAVFGDTRDSQGRQRFIPYNLEDAFSNTPFSNWVKQSDYYPYHEGYNCCSDRAVAFHYVRNHQMQVYEYLTNRLRYTDDV